jgi:hypothetical protein
MPDEADGAGPGDDLFPVDIVQFESKAFDFVFDIAPDDALDAVEFVGEKAKLKLGIEVLGHHLRLVPELEDDLFAVLDDRHLVIAAASEPPHQGPIVVGDIDEFVACVGIIEDAPDYNAEGAIGKLNEFDHTAGKEGRSNPRCQSWLDSRSDTRVTVETMPGADKGKSGPPSDEGTRRAWTFRALARTNEFRLGQTG